MLETIEFQSSLHPPKASVIWMHGLGADGYDFQDLAAQLRLPEALPIRFIFPHAPIRPVTLNGGIKMRAWFDLYELDRHSREDEKGLQEAHQQIAELIEQEHLRGIPYHRILLGGFSQGGALALYTGLRYTKPLGGIIALSTYLPLLKKLGTEANPAQQHTPIFLAHGEYDPILPFKWGEIVHRLLMDYHYSVDWHAYAMAHELCPQELVDIKMWLEKHLLA